MVRLTGEYGGGLLAGFGCGAIVMLYANWQGAVSPGWNPLVVVPAFACMAIGASLARASQKRAKTSCNAFE
jgi:hypothetical protein